MKKAFLSSILSSSIIFMIPPFSPLAKENPTTQPVTTETPATTEDIASGKMGGRSGSGRSSGGKASGVHPGGTYARPPSGGTYIVPGRGSSQPMPIPAYPGQPPIYSDEMPSQEEPPVPITPLPTFTLTNETPSVNIGDTITIRIPNIEALQPATIYWRFNGEDWTIGDTTFQHPATQPGIVTIDVVVQAADGLYSQSQTTTTSVAPSAQPPKTYYEQMGNNTTPTQPEPPPEKPKKKHRKKKLTQFLGIDPTSPEERTELGRELEQALSTQHTRERMLQDHTYERIGLEMRERQLLNQRPIGEDTPTPERADVERQLSEINAKIREDEAQIKDAKAKAAELNWMMK